MTAEEREALKKLVSKAKLARIKAEDGKAAGLIRSYKYEHGEAKNSYTPEQREAMRQRAKAARANGSRHFGRASS